MQDRRLLPAQPVRLLVGLFLVLGSAPGQAVRVVAPVGGAPVGAASARQAANDEAGIPVEMFENPNLDRYLRRAQAFLEREDYAAAIQVLQDVIEGRTIEVVGAPPEPAAQGSPAETAPADRSGEAPEPGRRPRSGGRDKAASPAELDARRSVFSLDGRLYRPVRRLCHEMLSRLPSVGVELYRATYEVAATELFERAQADGSVNALEEVANRYFVTLPAGRAMAVLADRLMHGGRYRAAVQVLRDMIEIYPADNRKRLGISEAWCRFKVALCLRLAGETSAAQEVARELAASHPDETLRILGELQAVKDLPQSRMFADEVLAMGSSPRSAESTWLEPTTERLVPLWQYRFKNPEPYRDAKAANADNRVVFFDEGMQATTMPHASRYGPATWVSFSLPADPSAPPHALFLEHFRLREADAATGVMLAQGDGAEEPPVPRENHPRVRIASSDFALLRPVEDEARRYVVLGHKGNTTTSVDVLRACELVAYARDTMQRAWSSAQWMDGEDGFREVTFLAAPTVFCERLLMPALRRGAYSLECLDRSSGRPLWHTPLHAGGTSFFKAPGAPVVVHGGIAYVATNAGCLAAVDAFAGDLRWIRRYERTDPLRPQARTKRQSQLEGVQSGAQFLQTDLPGFLPNELLVRDGLVFLAPCDADMLLCIDGATGKPVWMLDAATRHAPYGRLRALLGATRANLFAVSDKELVCIGLPGGLVRWSRELPARAGAKATSRGRGAVVGDWVVLPGDRELLVFDGSDRGAMKRIPLPSFDPSRDPLAGSCNVVSRGPWLALGYQGGVEVFSSREALQQLAEGTNDALRKAEHLVQAGDGEAAEAVLTGSLRDGEQPAARRAALATRLLSLVRDRAAKLAAGGDLAGGLACLDRILELLPDRTNRLGWHLARLEICKDVADLRTHEREQQRLYDYMEGRG